jgi:hypothetical protein
VFVCEEFDMFGAVVGVKDEDEDIDVETGIDDVEDTLGTENGDEIGGDEDGGRGRGREQFSPIQKISTTLDSAPL